MNSGSRSASRQRRHHQREFFTCSLAVAHGRDQHVNARPIIRTASVVHVRDAARTVYHEIAAELTGVFGGAPEPAATQ